MIKKLRANIGLCGSLLILITSLVLSGGPGSIFSNILLYFKGSNKVTYVSDNALQKFSSADIYNLITEIENSAEIQLDKVVLYRKEGGKIQRIATIENKSDLLNSIKTDKVVIYFKYQCDEDTLFTAINLVDFYEISFTTLDGEVEVCIQ